MKSFTRFPCYVDLVDRRCSLCNFDAQLAATDVLRVDHGLGAPRSYCSEANAHSPVQYS
jgi:hypothetical protein